MKKVWKLIISLVLPFLIGGIASLFTSSSVSTWYVTLLKPEFNPPGWIFGPVWTILYLMMGVSMYLVWQKRFAIHALALYFFQLVLNGLWSILFFGLKNPFYAFIEIIILWFAIVMTAIHFYKIEKMSAYLLLPYLLWVSFAAVLNFFIMVLN
jgi:translocator protein